MSVDPPEISEQLRKKLDFDIRFVSDIDGELMDVLNIRHDGGMPPSLIAGEVARVRESQDIFLPATYLVDEQGIIRWIARPDTYRVRVPASAVVDAVAALG